MAKRYQKKTLIVLLDKIDDRAVPYSLMGWWQEIDPSVKQGVLGIDTDLNEVARRIIHELGFKEAYSINDDIKKPTFNSVIDHPVLGDEREFIYIRQGGEKEWHRSIKLESGKQYEIKVNFRNDADPKYNYSSFDRQGIAVRTRMSIDVPAYISRGSSSKIKVRIIWEKDCCCEDSITIEAADNKSKKIEYVVGQEKIHSKWKADNSVLPSTLFSFDGTLIGLNSLNGVIPGGDEYSGYVNFYIDVDKEQRIKQVNKTMNPGWGPERKMFTMSNPGTYPSINSISDNPTIGDERDFLRIGEICPDKTKLSGINYSEPFLIQPNKRYLVYTYCHNACSSTYFDEKHDYSGAAIGIRLTCFYSKTVTPSSSGFVSSTITGDNTIPPSVWSTIKLISKENIILELEGPAKIYNDWKTNKQELPMTLFSRQGTMLGTDELDGIMFGEESLCSVMYVLKTKPVNSSQNDLKDKLKSISANLKDHQLRD